MSAFGLEGGQHAAERGAVVELARADERAQGEVFLSQPQRAELDGALYIADGHHRAAAAPWSRLSSERMHECLSLRGPCFLRAAREALAARERPPSWGGTAQEAPA